MIENQKMIFLSMKIQMRYMMLITINKDNLKTAIRRINKVNKIKN